MDKNLREQIKIQKDEAYKMRYNIRRTRYEVRMRETETCSKCKRVIPKGFMGYWYPKTSRYAHTYDCRG